MSITDTIFDLEQFTSKINEELSKGLPGFDAQKIMSPSLRDHALGNSDQSIAKDSSVLILFYPKNGQLYLPFIKRTTGSTNHSGQISLPGGKYEKSDSDRIITAIRETNEELGVDCNKINIIGLLTELYIPVSNFMVLPVLGYCTQKPDFKISKFEVDELIEIPVQKLLSQENIYDFSFKKKDITVHAPYFDTKGHKVWGATAMILSEVRALLLRAGLM